jgi:Fe-S oxidoreductase
MSGHARGSCRLCVTRCAARMSEVEANGSRGTKMGTGFREMSIKGLLMMGASVMLLSTPAIAQGADETEVTETRTLNAITVTARKREESLLETPLAVSAVDSSTI